MTVVDLTEVALERLSEPEPDVREFVPAREDEDHLLSVPWVGHIRIVLSTGSHPHPRLLAPICRNLDDRYATSRAVEDTLVLMFALEDGGPASLDLTTRLARYVVSKVEGSQLIGVSVQEHNPYRHPKSRDISARGDGAEGSASARVYSLDGRRGANP